MFKNFIVAAAVVVTAHFTMGLARAQGEQPIAAPGGTYVLEKTHASMIWRVNHMGMSNYTARFKSFDAKVNFDPRDLSRSQVEASIDLGSVETDFVSGDGRDFNAELRSEPFFNVVKFPQATFKSRAVQAVGQRRLKVSGDLTILGISRPMILDVVLNGAVAEHPFAKVPWLGISAQGKVARKAFGLNTMPQLTGIGDEVEVLIEAEFIRQN